MPAIVRGTAAWRASLLPASFRGATFKVESSTRASGRRVAFFEYPKRDDPYAEDMGRVGRRFPVQAYFVGPDYQGPRDALISALEQEGPGTLTLPTLGSQLVQPGPYSVTETREYLGFCVFDIQFFEAGVAANTAVTGDTQSAVANAGDAASSAAAASVDQSLGAPSTDWSMQDAQAALAAATAPPPTQFVGGTSTDTFGIGGAGIAAGAGSLPIGTTWSGS